MSRKLTQEEFIAKAKEKHGDKYLYFKIQYIDSKTKIRVVCPKHGDFLITPSNFLSGYGCPQCGKEVKRAKKTYTKEKFIQKAKLIHNDKYDYSKVDYINSRTKVCIICPEHGEFWQLPAAHLYGQGCGKCGIEKNRNLFKDTKETFITKARKVHGDKYDYSKVNYVNSQTKIHINCPLHGEFWQSPNTHLNGFGCPQCGIEKCHKAETYTLEEFIKIAKEIHGDKYDYSKVNYKNCRTKICVTCYTHGDFWVRPTEHITKKSGCPQCNSSHMEDEIRNLLIDNNVQFSTQNKFNWMGQLRLDFYLPKYNIAIECQGLQHFEPVGYFGGYESWLNTKKRDECKRQLCEEHGIKILYYANYDYDFPYEVITDKNELLKQIKKND